MAILSLLLMCAIPATLAFIAGRHFGPKVSRWACGALALGAAGVVATVQQLDPWGSHSILMVAVAAAFVLAGGLVGPALFKDLRPAIIASVIATPIAGAVGLFAMMSVIFS